MATVGDKPLHSELAPSCRTIFFTPSQVPWKYRSCAALLAWLFSIQLAASCSSRCCWALDAFIPTTVPSWCCWIMLGPHPADVPRAWLWLWLWLCLCLWLWWWWPCASGVPLFLAIPPAMTLAIFWRIPEVADPATEDRACSGAKNTSRQHVQSFS